MPTTLGNGTIQFGNGSTQSVSQLSNYGYTYNSGISLARNSTYTITSNCTSGPEGIIFVFFKSPWTCTEDNGLTVQYMTFQISPDDVNWTTEIQQYQYANGYSGRYTGGNFSLSFPIGGLSSGQQYYFRAIISPGNAATTFSPTMISYGV